MKKLMKKSNPSVAVYKDGRWMTTVIFNKTWKAYLFHWLLNMSWSHEGSREY